MGGGERSAQMLATAVPGAVRCEFGSGAALLDLNSHTYYSLNDVGAFIWDLIQEPTSVSGIIDAVTARYEVDAVRCRADIESLLQGLSRANLVTLSHAQAC